MRPSRPQIEQLIQHDLCLHNRCTRSHCEPLYRDHLDYRASGDWWAPAHHQA